MPGSQLDCAVTIASVDPGDISLFVAAGADGFDLVTGRYDLAGGLEGKVPLGVAPGTEARWRPLGTENPAANIRARQLRPRISRENWPFRLFLVVGQGEDDEMADAVRLHSGRVVGEEDSTRLYGRLGADVISLVTRVIANWDEVDARLSAEPAQSRPELSRMQLGQLASTASRQNLRDIGLMWSAEALTQYTSAKGGSPSFRDLRQAGRAFSVGREVGRTVLVVGLRDLLPPEDTAAYLQRWTEVTGVAVA